MSQLAERTHIGAYVGDELHSQLIELARRDDRSVSSVIRQALRAHLQREQIAANQEGRDVAGVTPFSG